MDAPADLVFTYAAHVFLMERYTTRTVRRRSKGNRKYRRKKITTSVAVLGVTTPVLA
jgi:hypothetical protein